VCTLCVSVWFLFPTVSSLLGTIGLGNIVKLIFFLSPYYFFIFQREEKLRLNTFLEVNPISEMDQIT